MGFRPAKNPIAVEPGDQNGFTPDGRIVFGATDAVYRVAASGGKPVRLTAEAEADSRGPVTRGPNCSHPRQAWVGSGGGALMFSSTTGGGTTQLCDARSRARYTRAGLLVARSAGIEGLWRATLSAYAFDPARGALLDPGTELADDASLTFGASDTGVLVYLPALAGARYHFAWVDTAGLPTGEGFATVGANPFNLSRDGGLLAYVENWDIMLCDLARGVTTGLVQGPGVLEPVLSPDGRQLAYSLNDPRGVGIVVQPTAGGTPRLVYKADQVTIVEDWSRDGGSLAANSVNRGLIIPLDNPQAPMV